MTREISCISLQGRILRRSNSLAAALLAIACGVLPPAAQADAPACRAASTGQTNVLVELFTSEGCNSCPPADRWLSALGKGPAVPARVVPIAWHVDYWDYIGWKDRFAQAAFSERQHKLAQLRRERVVYTPQILVQGRDFRRWSMGGFETIAEGVWARPARARIELSIVGHSASGVEVAVHARLLDATLRSAATAQTLYLVATASGLSSEVRAGENAGRRLAHDHVAFGWRGPISFGPDGELSLRQRLALPSAAPGASSVVAFVQGERSAEVVQALMLPVCPS
jgi:hypothetical protein